MDINKLDIKDTRCDDCIIIKVPKKLKKKIVEKAIKKYSNVSQYVRSIVIEDILKNEDKA